MWVPYAFHASKHFSTCGFHAFHAFQHVVDPLNITQPLTHGLRPTLVWGRKTLDPERSRPGGTQHRSKQGDVGNNDGMVMLKIVENA